MLQKEPNLRIQSISEIKKHPWLSSINWPKIMNKEVRPPIVPGPNTCCIDKEFLSLPLDFEDSGIPLPTERRQSCYYESTLVVRTSEMNTRKNSNINLLDLL